MRLIQLLAAAFTVVQAAIPGDLITNLPGWNGPTPTPQYSGLINIDPVNGRYLHYWFVQSEQAPATAPVVMWMNGGPGCSSLDGYFYEQGPFHFAAQQSKQARAAWNVSDADAIPTLVKNPYAWNTIANMLFVEAPAGVGFSYSNNQNDYNTNDNKTAADNYLFVQKWFAAYPEYQKNPFFITGESYAGIYVPTLADAIRVGNDAGNQFVNLVGFAVGNGCIGNAVGSCSAQGTGINIEFLHGHALYSTDLYNQIKTACPDPSNPSLTCYTLLATMGLQVSDVNIYDVYAPCVNSGFGAIPTHHIRHRTDFQQKQWRIGGPDECIDGLLASQYLNNDLVRAAIHVQNMSSGGQWSICGAQINYQSNIDSLLPVYPTLISKYRVLIYNGDVDACVAWNGNEQWTSSLGYPVKAGWHSWSVNSQVAGYATVYDAKNSSFSFVTVKGAGHMVPEYMPVQGLEMFNRFINNLPF